VYLKPLLRNRAQSYRVRRNNANYTAITPFKVIQAHRFWYQSKAHLLVINSNVPPILRRFQAWTC